MLINKKLIFTITSGRSGTKLLTKLVKPLKGVTATHEPLPSFNSILRTVIQQPYHGLRWLKAAKLPMISRMPESAYMETSHATCKGYIELFELLKISPIYIILRRPPRQVAMSMYKYGSIPVRQDRGWLLRPTDPNVLPMVSWQKATDYELCFWYTLEMERRYLYYQWVFTPERYRNVNMSDLTKFNYFQELMLGLDIDCPDSYRDVHSKLCMVNQNPVKRTREDLPIEEIIESETLVWRCVEYYAPYLKQEVEDYYGIDSE